MFIFVVFSYLVHYKCNVYVMSLQSFLKMKEFKLIAILYLKENSYKFVKYVLKGFAKYLIGLA